MPEKDKTFPVTISAETHRKFKARCAENKITMVKANEELWRAFGVDGDDSAVSKFPYVFLNSFSWDMVYKHAFAEGITSSEFVNRMIREQIWRYQRMKDLNDFQGPLKPDGGVK